MTARLRDTQFGQLVRWVSSERLLRYPDEDDFSLWRTALTTGHAGAQGARSLDDEEDRVQVPGAVFGIHDAPSALMKAESQHQASQTSIDAAEKMNGEALLVDWYGPADPENPQNWPSNVKLWVTFQICLLNWVFYMASSIYVPGELRLMEDFGVGDIVATLGLSLFTVGYALGPMLWSPLSEIPRVGRSSIYFWTMLAFTLLQLPIGYAVNVPMFLIFRFLAGFAGSPALATGGATLMDMYSPGPAAIVISVWGFFGICGPVFGPIIGGFAAQYSGWRLTIWVIAWLGAAATVLVFFCMPETSAAAILHRRAKRLRRVTGDARVRSQSEIDAEHAKARDHLILLGKAFTLTFFEPIVFVLDLYTALLYGILFTWFESFPLVFGEIYGFNISQQGLVFLGIFVGGLITQPLFVLWIQRGIVPQLAAPGFKPEMVLPPTFFGSACLPICLFFYGWTARESIHWIVPVIGSSFFTVSIICLFSPVLNFLGLAYPRNAASIFAGNTLFRASFGAVFPLFARQLFRKLGVGAGSSLLAGISVGFMPLPFIFYRYGERTRGMSKDALCT